MWSGCHRDTFLLSLIILAFLFAEGEKKQPAAGSGGSLVREAELCCLLGSQPP